MRERAKQISSAEVMWCDSGAATNLHVGAKALMISGNFAEDSPERFRGYGVGRNATADSAGKIHCSGVAVAIAPGPP